MESLLNLVWALLAALIVCLWLRIASPSGASRRTQAAAVAMLILILFPVISVTDDLQSLQNPAETATCERRDHMSSCPHSIFPIAVALPAPGFVRPPISFQRFSACLRPRLSAVKKPALRSIQNRPPPAA
jgi:hypothetical protein